MIAWLAAAALVLAAGLRRLLPAGQRTRGGATLLFFLLSLMLSGMAFAAHALGLEDPRQVLEVAAMALLAVGAVALVGMIVFDLLLARVGVRVPSLLRDLVEVATAVVILLGFLRMVGVNVLGLVTTSAVLTAVVGLALQNTIANVFGGLSLQLDRTLSQGDWIKVDEAIGRIAEIGFRATRLVTKDGNTVFVPNGKLISAEVLNFSRPSGALRMTIRVGFHYRHLPNAVRRVLLDAVREVPGVLPYPAPDCMPVEFADSAITYALRYWIADFERDVAIDGEVRTRVVYAARRAGLEIPFPIRTLVGAPAHEADAEQVRHDRAALLAAADIFRPLEEADRQRLAAAVSSAEFAAGEQIIRQGEPGDSLYLVERGEVGVHLVAEGASREVATLRRGDFFGEMSLLTGEPRAATCTARTDVACLIVDGATFREVLAGRPAIVEQLSAVLAERHAALAAQAEGLSTTARLRRTAEQQPGLLTRMQDFLRLRRS